MNQFVQPESRPEANPPMNYASFHWRILASIIDTFLSLIVLTPFFSVFSKMMGMAEQKMLLVPPGPMTPEQYEAYMTQLKALLIETLPMNAFQWTVTSLVVIIFWVYRSATPGKMILHMKIVDAKTGNPPSTGQLIGRLFAYIVSTVPLGLGFVWIYFDKRKQGWHDKLAGTVVIKY